MKGKYRPGETATIEWELKDTEYGPEFKASGVLSEPGGKHSSGQCLEDIAEAYPNDERVQEIVDIWRNYHLSGMHAGTPEQEALVKDIADYEVRTKKLAELFMLEVPIPDAITSIRALGGWPEPEDILVERECPCGGTYKEIVGQKHVYKYGTRWLHWPIPDEIIEKIKSWFESDQTIEAHYDYQAHRFLEKYGINITKRKRKEPRKYSILLRRNKPKDGEIAEFTEFKFWGSIADEKKKKKPSDYDILACLSLEIACPDTFNEFCADFGYNNDSIKALNTYNQSKELATKLKVFFDTEEREALKDIQ